MINTNIKKVKEFKEGNYVYVLLNDVGLVKIGITDSPYERFITIQNVSGSLITKFYLSESIENNYEIEQKLHKYFKKYNSVAEWYKNIDFNNVVNYVKKYINKNGKKKINATYVRCNKGNNNIINLDEYIETFAKIVSIIKMKGISIPDEDVFISKIDDIIFEYETLLYSNKDKINKALGLAPMAYALEQAIFTLLKVCDAKEILDNRNFYVFFHKYYNVEKTSNLNSLKNTNILC